MNANFLPNHWQNGDEDRQSSKHDEIVMWVEKNINEILPYAIPDYKNIWIENDFEWINVQNYGNNAKILREEVNKLIGLQKNVPVALNTMWEIPVTTGWNRTGFIDFCAFYNSDNIYVSEKLVRIEIHRQSTESIYFEIKTGIFSIGDTLRQIKTYQGGSKNRDFCLVSPLLDPDTVNVFRKNGIAYVPYLSGMENLTDALQAFAEVFSKSDQL